MKFAALILAVALLSSLANAQCTGSYNATAGIPDWSMQWTVRGDLIDFVVSAETTGWVGIGFSGNTQMTLSDLIVGAADTANPALSFVSDRYIGEVRGTPEIDSNQDVMMTMAEVANGRTTIYFTRARVTDDPLPIDRALNDPLRFLWATGPVININDETIGQHGFGNSNRGFSDTITLPSAEDCPVIGVTSTIASSPVPDATSSVVISSQPAITTPAPSPEPATTPAATSSVSETSSPVPSPSPTQTPEPSPTNEPVTSNVVCEGSFSPPSTSWIATWTVYDNDVVAFTVSAETTNWVAIGFSLDEFMPDTDIVVGAADPENPTTYFVSDRYASDRSPPRVDSSQDISRQSVALENRVTTISFIRQLNTSDRAGDVDLDRPIRLLWAIGGNVNNHRAEDPNNIARHVSRGVSGMMTLCMGELDSAESGSGTVSAAGSIFVLIVSVASLLVTMVHL